MPSPNRYAARKLYGDDPLSYDRKGAQRYGYAIYDILDWNNPVFRVFTANMADEIVSNLNRKGEKENGTSKSSIQGSGKDA